MDAMQNKVYTYEDYCKFNDDKRREVINGVIYLMTAPLREHQKILSNLFLEFGNYLRGKKCEVFPAAFDVRLPKEGETKETASTIVQPDIVVICDRKKLDRRGCFGAPDLVIEILSPSTGKRDMTEKFNLYQEHGVLEYWIIDPYTQRIDRFPLNKDTGKYASPEYFFRDDTISPIIFPDLTISLAEVFPPLDEYEDE
jgi:Uma2 family endonuclease